MQASMERLRLRREGLGHEDGFTLIEALIVIVLLGILAAIVVFAVQNLSGSSETAACQSDYKTVEAAVKAYKAQALNYPGGTAAPTSTDSLADSANAAAAAGPLLVNGAMAPNTLLNAAIGPWLKDAPTNSHYTIWVNNDGSGTVTAQAPSATAPAAGPDRDAFCSTL
jgi:general secretion pathway protein G